MSCNRQNYRPNNVQSRGTVRTPNCVAAPVAIVGCSTECSTGCTNQTGIIGSCDTNCQTQGGIVTGINTGAGCGAPCPNALLEEMPLGMAYVPWQTFGTMYPMREGFRKGTMFANLDYDFLGRRCN